MLSHDFLFVYVCILIGSYKTASYIGLGPILIISFNLITSCKVLSPNIVTFEVLEVRILPCEFEGNKIQPMTILFFSFCKVFFCLSLSLIPLFSIFSSFFPSFLPITLELSPLNPYHQVFPPGTLPLLFLPIFWLFLFLFLKLPLFLYLLKILSSLYYFHL